MSRPGQHLALSVVQPRSPVLRVRYRHGVLIGPYGYPDWTLCARAVVALPPADQRLTRDEARILDVLAANATMADAAARPDGDPLWPAVVGESAPVLTPAGWCWAHIGPHAEGETGRLLALVPIELHGSFRHAGGAALLPSSERGVRLDTASTPVGHSPGEPVVEQVLAQVEPLLGWALPPRYRRFIGSTNGAGPVGPAVCARFGFVADQPLFGLARDDQHQDLPYAYPWLRDRFTPDFLPIGYVQGGLLAVKVAGDDIDSIWYWDDDDPRDRQEYDTQTICAHLLHRCADSIDALWQDLVSPPGWLVQFAWHWVQQGMVRTVRDETVGAGLPAQHRAPWMGAPSTKRDQLTALFEAV